MEPYKPLLRFSMKVDQATERANLAIAEVHAVRFSINEFGPQLAD